MEITFYNLKIVLALIVIPLFTVSCHDNQVNPSPSITSLSPSGGPAGTKVTIVGNNFSDNSNNVVVAFGTKPASISVFSSTEIKVKAPSGFNNETANVTVSVNGKVSNRKPFVYNNPAPTITSIAPDSAKSGTIITITGLKFGLDKSKVKVQFDEIDAADITSVTNTQIKVKVPKGFREQKVSVKVIVSNWESNKNDFYYTDIVPPSITSLTDGCFYNSTVVINGNYFSPEKDSNIVRFGGKEATVISASKTSLTVRTPDLGNATGADVTVTKYGEASNIVYIPVNYDQNKVATYNWTTDTIQKGLVYKTGQFDLFGNIKRRMYILDVTLNSNNKLGIGFSTNNAATVTMCKNYGAVAGTNAGYFPFLNSSDKDPYIRINGTTVQVGDQNVSRIFTNSALLIHNNVATVRKFTEGGKNLNQVAAVIPLSEAEDVIVSGPMLITDGKIENLDMSIGHNYSQTSRTGFGVTNNGKHIFMVVVDTKGGVTGVSTLQLAKILQALGSVNAMNFDGGGSSNMFVKGRGDNGRVNFPYGGTYQRPVRSVIYIK